MKVLIVGGGGREHALAWKLRRDDPNAELIAAPGNPGIGLVARCVPIAADKLEPLADLAEAQRVDFTVVGPEVPLEAGIVESVSVARASDLRANPRSGAHRDVEAIREGPDDARRSSHRDERRITPMPAPRSWRWLTSLRPSSSRRRAWPLEKVSSSPKARRRPSAPSMRCSSDHVFGAAGAEILIEEFMEGEELSLFVITDGENALPFLAAQDHKRLLDGDFGPNTGGMGAYAPTSIATPDVIAQAMREIIDPTLAAMREEGCPFTGLLYAGLMLTAEGPRVVEFNCRFGDPETQALMPLMEIVSARAAGGRCRRWLTRAFTPARVEATLGCDHRHRC